MSENREIVLPKSSLGYHTNNIYPQFPPLMADGRTIIATEQSETLMNNDLLKMAGVKTNWEYRQFLTNNSIRLQEINRYQSFNDVGYYKRFASVPGMSSPEFNNSHTLEPRTYGVNSDLKDLYISREQLNARIYSPVLTEEWIRNISNES